MTEPFEILIGRAIKSRNWEMVRILFLAYGMFLERTMA